MIFLFIYSLNDTKLPKIITHLNATFSGALLKDTKKHKTESKPGKQQNALKPREYSLSMQKAKVLQTREAVFLFASSKQELFLQVIFRNHMSQIHDKNVIFVL